MLGGAAVLLVLALVAGGIAAVQSDRAGATQPRRDATAGRRPADARRVGARAQLTDDISLSLLLAAAGARLDDSPETRVNLLAALAKQPHLVRSAPPGGGYLEVMDVSPDGRWIASSDDQNRMHLYDAATNRLLRSYDAGRPPGDEPASMLAAFSPDSSQLAVVLWGVESTEPVRLLDPDTMQPTATGSPPRRQTGHRGSMSSSAPTDATSRPPCMTFPWSRMPARHSGLRGGLGPALPVHAPHPGADRHRLARALALSPDGQTLYTGWPLTAYDVASGETIWREPEHVCWLLDVNADGDPARTRGRMRAARGRVAGGRGHRRHGRHAAGSPGPGARHPVLPRRLARGVCLRRRRAHRLGHRHRPAAGTVGHLR